MDRTELIKRINAHIESHRDQCLWFLRKDYVPEDDAGRLRALLYIQRHGTRQAAREAAELSQWLLQHSSDASVAS